MIRPGHAFALAAMLALLSASTTLGAQQLPYRVSDQQLKDLLRRIDTRAKTFRESVGRVIDPAGIGADPEFQSGQDFQQALERLRDRVNGRRSNTADVERLLEEASAIDSDVTRNHRNTVADRQWQALRGDLDDLARAYNVAWNRSDAVYGPAASSQGRYHTLVGTYRLDSSRGDNPRQAAEQAARAIPSQLRQATYLSLISRLESPNMIAIDRDERTVTLASSRDERRIFEVDGQVFRERGPTGHVLNTSLAFVGVRLVATTIAGESGGDFTVTFEPAADGRTLEVTRTISDESLLQPVSVKSFYRKSSNEARFKEEQ